jgi:hypothetical protein
MNLLPPSNCRRPAECGAVLAQVLTSESGLQSTAQIAEGIVNELV